MTKLKLDLVCQVAVVVWDLESGVEWFRRLLGFDEATLSFGDSAQSFQTGALKDATYQGKPAASFHYRQSNFFAGGMDIEMFAPADPEEENPFTDFLREHGPGIHHLNIRLANRQEGLEFLTGELGIAPFFDLMYLGRNCAYFDLRRELGLVVEVGSRVVGPRAALPEEALRVLTEYGSKEEANESDPV